MQGWNQSGFIECWIVEEEGKDSANVFGYDKFLQFINLRAQTSECLLPEWSSRPNQSDAPRRNFQPQSEAGVGNTCTVCKGDKHALFACPQFKSMTQDKMSSIVRNNNCVSTAGLFINTAQAYK